MFATYLRRELLNRRRQTLIIAVGMALAIALVILVSAFASGVRNAQASVLQSVYGVGTDITVTEAAQAPTGQGDGQGGGQRFDFGSDAGTTTDGTTSVSQSQLSADRASTTFEASALDTIAGVSNVSDAIGVLSLTNTTFNGELPDFSQTPSQTGGAPGADAAATQTAPTGGADGAGGSSFDVDSFTVLGIDPAGSAIGPLADVSLDDGRTFTADDAGQNVAVVDASYATTAELAVGSTVNIGGTDALVIGIVSSTGTDATTASNVYLPLDVAQTLSGETGMISSVYVQAASSTDIDQIQADIETALPDTTVSTQADLASTVSGSLSTAGDLVANLGTWLSLIVLAAAFLIAILFTISGVTRRTREFGTLKAIGWSNGRIVRQVAGESVVQGLLGGAFGIVLGLAGILVVNLIAPTLSGSSSTTTAMGGVAGPGGGGEFGGGPGAAAQTSTDIALNLPVTVSVILLAVGLAVLGGLLAGAIGGWRASRLRPAAALRSVG